jgi:MarR family transcriptional regulator for hemolysin
MKHSVTAARQMIVAATLLTRQYRRQADTALANCGLSEVMAWPILMIGRDEGMRQVDLANLLGIEGPTLVRTLHRLEAEGLVVRRDDPSDGRAKTLHLTAAGRRMRVRIDKVVGAFAVKSFEGVAEADVETCLRVFGQVDARLAAISAKKKT